MCTKSVGVMRVPAPLVMVLLLVTSVAPVYASDPVPGIDIALDDIIFFPRQKQKDDIRKTLVEAGLKEEGVNKIMTGLDDLVQASAVHHSTRENIKLTMKNAGVPNDRVEEIVSKAEVAIKEEGTPAKRTASPGHKTVGEITIRVKPGRIEFKTIAKDGVETELASVAIKEEGVKKILDGLDDLAQASAVHHSTRKNVKPTMKNAGVSDDKVEEILSMVEVSVKEEGVSAQGRKRPGSVKYEDIRKTLVEAGVKEEGVKKILDGLDDMVQVTVDYNSSRSNVKGIMKDAGVSDGTINEILSMVDVAVKEEGVPAQRKAKKEQAEADAAKRQSSPGHKHVGEIKSMVDVAVKEEGVPAQSRKRPGQVKYEDIRKTLVKDGVKEEEVKEILAALDDLVQCYSTSRENVKSAMKNAGVSDDKIEEIVRRVEEDVQVRGGYISGHGGDGKMTGGGKEQEEADAAKRQSSPGHKHIGEIKSGDIIDDTDGSQWNQSRIRRTVGGNQEIAPKGGEEGYAGNGGIVYENDVPEESGTLNTEAAKTIDEHMKEKGWLGGILVGLTTWPFRIGPSTVYGVTKEIPNSKFVVDYPVRTIVSEIKGAVENPLETIVTGAMPVVINNSGLSNKGGTSDIGAGR